MHESWQIFQGYNAQSSYVILRRGVPTFLTFGTPNFSWFQPITSPHIKEKDHDKNPFLLPDPLAAHKMWQMLYSSTADAILQWQLTPCCVSLYQFLDHPNFFFHLATSPLFWFTSHSSHHRDQPISFKKLHPGLPPQLYSLQVHLSLVSIDMVNSCQGPGCTIV